MTGSHDSEYPHSGWVRGNVDPFAKDASLGILSMVTADANGGARVCTLDSAVGLLARVEQH